MSALVGFLGGVVATLAVIIATTAPRRRVKGPSPEDARKMREEMDLLQQQHEAVQRWMVGQRII
jgi:hypothetical protein